MLGDTGNKRAVRILLKCILVHTASTWNFLSARAEMYISVSLLPSTYFVISMRDTSRNPTQTDSFKLLYSQELKIIHLCRYRHSPCKLLPK